MTSDPEIGISTATFYPGTLAEDALVTITALGFHMIEIFLQADGEYSASFGAVLDRRRRELGLDVHSLNLDSPLFDLWSPYPRLAREKRDRFQQLLEVATVLDARALQDVGYRGPLILEPAHVEDTEVLVEAREFVRQGWARVGE